jgi:hypothetical protein
VLESKALPVGSITSCEMSRNPFPKWGKLEKFSKTMFDPESGVVPGLLPSKEWVDPTDQTAWGLWQVRML